MIKKRCFLQYPCGKLLELKMPIIIDTNGKLISILPDDDNYFNYAKEKFQINNLKVVEKEMIEKKITEQEVFISLIKKRRSIE